MTIHASSTMTKEVITVPTELPVSRAWEIMKERRIRHLPVVQLGRLVGILSDRDVLEHRTRGVLCGEAMTPSPLAATRGMTVSEMASIMIDRKIDALPVVDLTTRVLGLVTATDLLELLVEKKDPQSLPYDFHISEVDVAGRLLARA